MKILPSSLLLAALALGHAAAGAAAVPDLPVVVTEEGQRVAFDKYTWRRRELAKRLPLDQAFPEEKDADKLFEDMKLPKEPAYISSPARILPDLYLINNDPNHTYIIDAGEGLILIDPGMTTTVPVVRANIAKLGLGGKKVRWVLNTHAHFDHAMADEEFRKEGAEIMIGAADADAVEKGTAVAALYLFDAKIPYPNTKVSNRIADGEFLKLGNKTLIAIATPGHTPGSTCYLLQLDGKNILFGGDTLLYDNRLGYQGTAYADNRLYLDSLKKLANFHTDPRQPFHWDLLMPGHGAIVMDRANMDVEKGFRTTQTDVLEGYSIEALPFATRIYRLMMLGRP